MASAAPVALDLAVLPAAETRQPVVVPKQPAQLVQPVQEVAQAPVIPEPVAQAPAKPMRTLEEVRADLARLRERSRERQAQAPVSRDIGFAPTDFMDFAQPLPQPSHRDASDSNFAPTDFMDFAQPVIKSRKREAHESNFAPTAFIDFSALKVRAAH